MKNTKFRLLSIIAFFLLITSIVITGCQDEIWVTTTITDAYGKPVTITYQIINVTTTTTITDAGSTATVTTTDAGSTATFTTTDAGSTATVTVTECPPYADLAIMNVEFVYPDQSNPPNIYYPNESYIHPNQQYIIEVTVKNVGQIDSGGCGLHFYFRDDTGSQATGSPWWSFQGSLPPLGPGEENTYTRPYSGPSNAPGGYELMIELVPYLPGTNTPDPNDPIDNNIEWEHIWLTNQ